MTRETCCTSMPRARRSVVMSTRDDPERNSFIRTSRCFCSMSPCYQAMSSFGLQGNHKKHSHHGRYRELPRVHFLSQPIDLPPCVAENNSLGDGDGLIEIAQRIQL